MKLFKQTSIVALFAFMLTACATPYHTEKSFWTFGNGFQTTQIAPDSWQISFVGNDHTDRALVRKYVMYKSAELCQHAGFAYFTYTTELTNRDSNGQIGIASADNNFMLGTSGSINQSSSVVEVTGLKTKPEHSSSRVYDTQYLLAHLNVDK